MPYYYERNSIELQRARKKRAAERKRRHDDIERRWRAGELTWNEYCWLEKKYR